MVYEYVVADDRKTNTMTTIKGMITARDNAAIIPLLPFCGAEGVVSSDVVRVLLLVRELPPLRHLLLRT